MEGGKREEAGPSTGFSEEKQEREQREMTEKPLAVEVRNDHEEEDDDKEDGAEALAGFVPGPLISLKEQIEKDKDDDSLRRWNEKLLGCVEGDLNCQMEPEVKFHSIGIISNDFGEVNYSLPIDRNRNGLVMFTLKEGSRYQLKLTFSVLHNIVSGLTSRTQCGRQDYKLIKTMECWVLLHLSENHMCTFWMKRLHHLGHWQGEFTLQSLSLMMMTEDVTWNSYSFEIKKSS